MAKSENLNEYDIIPLNNTFTSVDGITPISKVVDKRSNLFNYNNKTKRYSYNANGGRLAYNFNLFGVGMISMKIYYEQRDDKQYVFQNKDTNNKTLGVYCYNNKLYLEIDGQSYQLSLEVENNEWKRVTLSFKQITTTPGEMGYLYSFILRCDDKIVNNSKIITSSFETDALGILKKQALTRDTRLIY